MLVPTNQLSFALMDNLTQIERHSNELATAVKNLARYSRSADAQRNFTHALPLDPEPNEEVHRAVASILSNATRVRALVCGPTDFLKHLASQSEILACLRWLGEFQILACIPMAGSVPITDVADLSSVPKAQLGRIVRLTATMGFLCEPQPGHVAHTPLSAPFVTNPSLLDAAMFLTEVAAPAALHMAPTTQRFAGSDGPAESAWNVALNVAKPFHDVRMERPKLSRQYSAYLHHAAGLHTAEEVVDLLSRLNWSKLGDACIVEVGAQSLTMAQCLADLHPGLRLVVQINNAPSATTPADRLETSNGRITVMCRAAGSRQPVTDAAVYILHLPPPSPRSAVLALLQEHMDVLRSNSGVMVLLTARLLPEPGSLSENPGVEAVARTRDLSMLQLANEGEMEMVELLDMIDRARDSLGKLVVTDRLRSRDSLVVALVVKHQAYTNTSRFLDSLSPNPF